jgi:hypothetical protein
MIKIAKFLESQNHKVLSDWIYVDEQLVPFTEHITRVHEITEKNINSILDTDIFLMFNDLTGMDIFTEMGICMANKILKNKDLKIYLVGDYDKTSFMQLYPLVTHFKNLKEVFEFEKIDCTDFDFPEII